MMHPTDKEDSSIPTAEEAPPFLEYSRPKSSISVWQLGEIVCRYVFAFVVVTFGTMLLQGLVARLLNDLPRRMKGDPLVIPYWLFIALILGISTMALTLLVWRLSRHPVGRALIVGWTFLSGLMFVYATDGFFKVWNRGW